MWFEAFVEVHRADHCVDHGHNQENDREDGKSRQGVSRGAIFSNAPRVGQVHAEEFEAEVSQSTEVDHLDQGQQ